MYVVNVHFQMNMSIIGLFFASNNYQYTLINFINNVFIYIIYNIYNYTYSYIYMASLLLLIVSSNAKHMDSYLCQLLLN